MQKYLVAKRVKLLVGRKTYQKDMIISAEDVGQDKIDRYLSQKYIKPIGNIDETELADEDNGDEALDGFDLLSSEEVAALKRPELLKYAKLIGLEDFARNIKNAALVDLINEFVEENYEEAEADEEEDEDEGGEDDGKKDPADNSDKGGAPQQ